MKATFLNPISMQTRLGEVQMDQTCNNNSSHKAFKKLLRLNTKY